jgi:pilus assembly protein CpaF
MVSQLNGPAEGSVKAFMPDEYFEFKSKIHDRLLEELDLSVLDRIEPSILKAELKGVVDRILREDPNSLPLNAFEKERLFSEILDEVLGFGPLEPLLQDPTISDILVNTYKKVYVERYGKLESTDVRFKDDDHLRKIIDKIVSAVGRRIDESSPMVDVRASRTPCILNQTDIRVCIGENNDTLGSQIKAGSQDSAFFNYIFINILCTLQIL